MTAPTLYADASYDQMVSYKDDHFIIGVWYYTESLPQVGTMNSAVGFSWHLGHISRMVGFTSLKAIISLFSLYLWEKPMKLDSMHLKEKLKSFWNVVLYSVIISHLENFFYQLYHSLHVRTSCKHKAWKQCPHKTSQVILGLPVEKECYLQKLAPSRNSTQRKARLPLTGTLVHLHCLQQKKHQMLACLELVQFISWSAHSDIVPTYQLSLQRKMLYEFESASSVLHISPKTQVGKVLLHGGIGENLLH